MSINDGHGPEDGDCIACDAASAVELIIDGRPRGVGTLQVARVLPSPKRRLLGPFAFLDHMGPALLPPGRGFDVPPHPHIGLSTVTYFLDGENTHRDSLGTVQVNRADDVNLMTAGRGIVHSERATAALREHGGTMHGLQMWLALPEAHEQGEPSFEHHPKATLPEVAPAAGVSGRVLLGEAFGATSPIRHPSEPLLVCLTLEAGAQLELEAAANETAAAAERGVYVIEGELQLGGEAVAAHRLAVLRGGQRARMSAVQASRILLLGGAPMGPRFIDWNFVASTKEQIDAARAAWKAQTFPKIPGDDEEFVPYPDFPRGSR
jgi:redox-sensitive bicupin YhaK (pirin superfamily)